jgi:hypothetical protein
MDTPKEGLSEPIALEEQKTQTRNVPLPIGPVTEYKAPPSKLPESVSAASVLEDSKRFWKQEAEEPSGAAPSYIPPPAA